MVDVSAQGTNAIRGHDMSQVIDGHILKFMELPGCLIDELLKG
jgi:hypothetical protein